MEFEWDFFISHAGEDKDTVARPLADELAKQGFRVWLDDHSLLLGRQLRDELERVIAASRYGIIILSPSFFRKSWPRFELEAIESLEREHQTVRVLPVWHDVDHESVASYSTALAERVGISTDRGILLVAQVIIRTLAQSQVAESKVVLGLRKFIEAFLAAVIEDPTTCQVNLLEGNDAIVVEILPKRTDLGVLIGREGKTAYALRTLMAVMSARARRRVVLQLLEGPE